MSASRQARRGRRALLLILAADFVLPAGVQADTFTVSTTDDPPTGFRCPAANGQPCTLRAALGQNDDDDGGDTIIVPAGHYTITGPLEVQHDATVAGAPGGDAPVIDAAGGGSAFIVAPAGPGAPPISLVTLSNLFITESASEYAIDAADADGLALDHVTEESNAGGGLHAAPQTTITDSTFADNIGRQGGAIQTTAGQLNIVGSEFDSNTAAAGGALALSTSGSVQAVNTTFDCNFGNTGPVAWIRPPNPPNAASVDQSSSVLRLSFDTVIGQNPVNGGALTGVQIDDTVLADNHGGSCDGPISSAGHNLSDDHTCGLNDPTDRQDLDPRLGPVSPNGGPVPTALPLNDSPLLDAGSSSCPPADARGVPRPQGAGCDIGAAGLATRPPIATTGGASGTTVNGSVDPGGETTQVTIQYGRSSAYGLSAQLPDVGGWSPAAISATLPRQAPGETVHYRVVATNASGTSTGVDATTVVPLAPLAISRLLVRVGRGARSATATWVAARSGRLTFTIETVRTHKPRARMTVVSAAGRNVLRIRVALMRHLANGRYRLVASASMGPNWAPRHSLCDTHMAVATDPYPHPHQKETK